ncbi:TolC family protein [Flagellimonas taeanensis]|uniref:Outer membrane protein TolC n=1 Tax=Flagellimonas taeanensis TaxID=1005926 RepID=A0A1M6Z6B0_9FLAO|nr:MULTISPECIES: TolC family protein [Allomuricauda]MDC6386120.1 TolC family protein [Muricauda sp. SK9]RIV50353.1 TolC family protein [Allomuricauda taeanensis]SFC11401.1 Outer membrane protein TolC [Allomuricauda taeanensis]SHL25970.1 Outer membrane protein TolC [Allomuricauda taeanensis]
MPLSSRTTHFCWIFFLVAFASQAQQDSLVLGFKEYLGYVKKYHPIAKQAQLTIATGQANLMKARGGFDPKVEVDYDRKQFKDTEYWDRLNTTFKIPTWFGIELKGNYQQNAGEYLSASETLPKDGLYSAGISMSLLDGFWANERMATLRKAKFFSEQSKADQDILVNEVLYKASIAYFDWMKAYRDAEVFKDFLDNADIRFQGIRKSALAGDIAMIDTVEAKIAVSNRELGYEQAKVELMKKSLEVSNFLWIEDVPVELREDVTPDLNTESEIDVTLEILGKPLDSFSLENHPKLRSLEYKIDGLTVDKRLKANKLLPKLDVEYNFLSETPDQINSFVTENYKGGVSFQLPLFLRKERGDLKLAKFKLMDAEFERDNAQVEIQNKVIAIYRELDSFITQNQLIADIVQDYSTLLDAEERKFSFGESSLFLVNSRESKLIDAYLKRNEMQNKFFHTKAKLFKSLAINPENL